MRKIIIIVLLLVSCVRNQEVVLSSDQLTVEGVISENNFAEIYLTNSLAFSGVIDSLEVAKSIEAKAKVELFDGETSEILTLKKDNSRFPFLSYKSNTIQGDPNRVYSLIITIRNMQFTSKTTIPSKPEILEVNFVESLEDGVINPNFKDIELVIDNKTIESRYFKVLIKNEEEDKFNLAGPFIFNTENISTKTFPLIVTYVDFENHVKINQLEVNKVFELKLIAITKEQFEFWKSVKGDKSTFIENSSFTNEVKTNISNGAFGYWSGENVTSVKFKIPK
ncbi:DUF4249 family protein [Algibacter pectinivorans]|uniref:DUF4249 domain-containing protein n=1 Tax=Algibacter pectinivorans TaxID=870482 RepID=A0A1I1MQG9_9FLAO|nr:DUF4249 family protein [Algibacter pectinivorans]SFC87102.1 protein of unknown function [Algibacter pectinivorans]